MDEFELIETYVKSQDGPPLIMGHGDDCSVVQGDHGLLRIETTDCLIEDVHFRRQTMGFSDLGFKSLAVNLSDIAAMGGIPRWAHLTLGIPSGVSKSDVGAFFQGFYELAEAHGVRLIGGDLSASPHSLMVNIHLSGDISPKHIKYRKNLALPGALCVTGPLGDSAAGLHILESNDDDLSSDPLVGRHKRPPVELAKAQWLASRPEVLGMMDVSDGLVSDLHRIEKAYLTINVEDVPMSKELLEFSQKHSLDPLPWILGGGEDYRLLFNVQTAALENLKKDYFAKFSEDFFFIGESQSGEPKVEFLQNGSPLETPLSGYRHFE